MSDLRHNLSYYYDTMPPDMKVIAIYCKESENIKLFCPCVNKYYE